MADASSEPAISADKLKAAVTLGLSLEQAAKTGAVPLAPERLRALQTLGLTLKEAVDKGLIKAAPAAPAGGAPEARAPAAAKAPAGAAEAKAPEAEAAERKREEQHTQPSGEQAQEQERRRAAAARFAAARTGGGGAQAAKAGQGQGQAQAAEAGGALAVPGGASDETLVEAVGAVVAFKDASGAARALAPQASEVAYLASDAVFWPLLRRLGAEVLALEAGEDIDAMWASAPSSSEGALQFAESRGYLLPRDLAAPAADGAWRRAMLAEAASDLMTVRVSVQRGFDLPALAGPAEAGKGWVERPAENLQGVASAVDSSASAELAEALVRDLGGAAAPAAPAAPAGPNGAPAGGPLAERLSALAEALGAAGAGAARAAAPPESGPAPALRGGWNLLQEMRVREAARGLREEYTVRRRILLRRLDVTVQVMCSSERAATAAVQRKTTDILSAMWAGWRRDATEAPPLSEWSALAVTRGVLARAVTARVSGPGARVTSKVKKVSIGAVPNRGGKPEGYTKKDPGSSSNPSTTEEPKAASAVTVSMPKAQRGPRQRSFASGSGATAVGSAPAAAADASSSASAAGAAPAAAPGGAAAAPGGAAAEPAFVGAKAEEKKAPMGARSTNKDAHKEYRQLKRKEWEGKVSNDYYEELAKHRKAF